MLRRELLDKLETVAPALSSHDLIPVLTHFWFTGSQLMAYSDQIAISVPCKTEVVGAVPGKILLDMVKSSKAKEVEFTPDEKELQIKLASSRIKLGLLPESSFVFKMPKPKESGKGLPVKPSVFVDALRSCLRSVSGDTSVTEQLGITLVPAEKALLLFSTNNATMSHAIVKLSGPCPLKERVLLPANFCRQIIALAGGEGKTVQLEVYDDHALFVSGSTLLFGRVLETQQPVDFVAKMGHYYNDKTKKQMAPMPTKLEGILDRAIIVADAAMDQGQSLVSVKDGVMRFHTKSPVRGEVSDSMQVGEELPNCSVKLEPKLLKNGYADFSRFTVNKDGCIMTNDDASEVYLVSGGTA